MSSLNDALLQQSSDAAALARGRKLAAGRTVSLRPRTASVLWVRQGRAWATLGVQPCRRGGGDYVLEAGERLAVPSGRHLVIEPLDGGTLGFECLPALESSGSFAQGESLRQPLRDLLAAARLAASALLCLLCGLASFPAILLMATCRRLRG